MLFPYVNYSTPLLKAFLLTGTWKYSKKCKWNMRQYRWVSYLAFGLIPLRAELRPGFDHGIQGYIGLANKIFFFISFKKTVMLNLKKKCKKLHHNMKIIFPKKRGGTSF